MRILLFTIFCSVLFEVYSSEVCESDDCKAVANELKNGMNESVDPCKDFYEFTCGSLNKNHAIPPWSTTWDRFMYLQDVLNQRIKNILEEEPLADDILPVRQAKRWYQACMNTERLELLNLAPLESILVQTGGWPMTIDREEWDEDAYSWQTIEELYFHLTGSHIFYTVKPSVTAENAINIQRGTLPLANEIPTAYRNLEYKEHKTYIGLFATVAFKISEDNKANISKDMFEDDIVGIIAMEKMLLDIPDADDSGEETIVLPVEEFEKMYNEKTEGLATKIDIKKLLEGMFDMVSYVSNEPLNMESKDMKYLVELTKILNNTPKRVIINYLHWHFISSMLSSTTENMRTALFEMVENAFEVKERKPRWQECISEVKMPRAIAYAYAQKYYTGETEQTGRDLIENIRGEMRDQIQNAAVLDDKSRALALEKLNKMGVVLGVPEWFKNKTFVSNSYKGLIIDNNHLDNVLSAKKYDIRQNLKTILKGGPNYMNDLDPVNLNAYYTPQLNAMYIPAANFIKPLFTPTLPNYVNYGSIGMFIGHEIGHAFDSNGIKKGLTGEPTAIDKEVLDRYDQRAKCFLKQYDGLIKDVDMPDEEKKKSYGQRTLGENIADNSGFQSIHNSYKKMMSKRGPEKKLPGFEKYSDEQMFFVSFAAAWCEMKTPKFEQNGLETDEHASGKLRVIGVVQNSEDFEKAFNCPKGSPMVRDEKCNMWERAH